MRYLLDTNILSTIIRDPEGPLARRVLAVDSSKLCTSIIVAAELRYGVSKRDSRRLGMQVETVLDSILILPVEPPVDIIYGRLRTRLEVTGQPIGQNDLFIASQAVALGLTVVTDNEREFRRIDELLVENWLRDLFP